MADPQRAKRLTAVEQFPAKTAITGEWPTFANSSLVSAYQKLGITRPWQHQSAAAEAIGAGHSVALATGTGTGKSLAFWLPALTKVLDDADATILYLAPTKALAADQLVALNRLIAALPPGTRRPQVATCDGDTPTEERRYIVDYAEVILTNPDFIHYSMLPSHRRWTRFLKNLQLVIIDEGHQYRGIFGSHVAQILRRLSRLVQHYGGAAPQYVVASATSADPITATARLIGAGSHDVIAITEDTAPAGTRTLALWQPPEVPSPTQPQLPVSPASAPGFEDAWQMDPFDLPDPMAATDETELPVVTESPTPSSVRRSALAESAELLRVLVETGNRTLAFTRSRRGAETVSTSARTQLKTWRTGKSRDKSNSAMKPQVAAYRGGYLPEERRNLEQALRVGEVMGLATTNALELGVDISGLDAVLIAGWPGTMMSLWQQAGRAGRAGADGLVVFVARDDPLDQYLVTHPAAVFERPLEQVVFDPENRFVLAGHLCAAAAERPVQAGKLAKFGNPETVLAVLTELTDAGVLRRRDSGWYWTHHESAAALVDIRGAGGAPIRVVDRATGQLLGTVDAGAADLHVHTGAVYVHQGVMFVVDDLDLADRVAYVSKRKVDYGTWARQIMSLEITQPTTSLTTEYQQKHWGPVAWGLGPIQVTTQVVSFERRRIPDLIGLGTEELDLPERTLDTIGVWFSIPGHMLSEAGVSADELPGALHAAEHAAIALLPLFATCDRWDLGGLSTDHHPDTGEATIFVYDALPGGAGFAARGFEVAADWLAATRDLIANCKCELGCPACIQSPKCGNYNSPLDKQGAVKLLNAVLTHY